MYNPKSAHAEEFIDHQEVLDTLEEAARESGNHQRVLEILEKAALCKGLTHREAAILMDCNEPGLEEKIYSLAASIKHRFYGNRIVLFAPLYLSNYCINGCTYCPYHAKNRTIPRRKLSQQEIEEEVRALIRIGHKRLAVEAGEDPRHNPLEYIIDSIKTIYSVREGGNSIRRVNVNIAATDVDSYRKLHEAGIGTYILFQETYNKENYQRLHPTGPKSNYEWHTEAMDRAQEGGCDDVGIGKIKSGDDNIYEIITDKSILLTDDNFKKYGKIEEDKDIDLHFCFIAEEETSYLIKIYYQQHTEEAQRLNFLLPGIRMDDMLPSNNMTKYNLLYLQQNKDIKININVKKGNVELYAFFSYEENPYVNKEMIKILEDDKNLIRSKQISYQTYEIKIDKSDNICLLTPKLNDNNCALYAIIYCNSNIDCLYDAFFDHIGDVIYMKPKVPYSNVITQKEVDLYEVHITDENIKNFAVILTQNTGITKLKLTKFFSTKGNINFGNTEKLIKNIYLI